MIRKIPLGRQSLTGYLPIRRGIIGDELAYESRLERDALVLLQFEIHLQGLKTQPFTIPYDHNGRVAHYTPDILAMWHTEAASPFNYRTMVFEVKPKARLERDRDILEPKFNAGRKYCARKGWGFSVLTEDEIRTPKLKNVELLMSHWLRKPDEKLSVAIIEIVSKANGPITIKEVEQRATKAGWPLVDAASAVNNLIASRWLIADLDQPLAPDTTLRFCVDEAPFHEGKTEDQAGADSFVEREARPG